MRGAPAFLATGTMILLLVADRAEARHHRGGNGHKPAGDISLWIDQQQIKMFSGESSSINLTFVFFFFLIQLLEKNNNLVSIGRLSFRH